MDFINAETLPADLPELIERTVPSNITKRLTIIKTDDQTLDELGRLKIMENGAFYIFVIGN